MIRWNSKPYQLGYSETVFSEYPLDASLGGWRRGFCRKLIELLCLLSLLGASGIGFSAEPIAASTESRVLEVAGTVEFQTFNTTQWVKAKVELRLRPGDRLRTGLHSRAALQLSDRSVIRLESQTTIEIQAPRNSEKHRFRLPSGTLFFFNREKPAEVEFETPFATGAIRGTEFVLGVSEATSLMKVSLLDGLVDLQSPDGPVQLQSGEQATIRPGVAPVKAILTQAANDLQWALYYPAILYPGDLQWTEAESRLFQTSLERYSAGDVLGAMEALPPDSQTPTDSEKVFRAALRLTVGEVTEAERLLQDASPNLKIANAIRELVSTIRTGGRADLSNTTTPSTASEWLARSYTLQFQSKLSESLAAARQAIAMAPEFGFAVVRLAELLMSFSERREALTLVHRALQRSPSLSPAHVLRGFVLLEMGRRNDALVAFERARELDPSLGSAWLGRGMTLLALNEFQEARRSFQAAAALEPQRSLYRSYLGKAAMELRDPVAAAKELRLARQLDPKDPTGWLYSALSLWEQHRLNAAIRDLEEAFEQNDHRSVFRSRLLLDEDRAVQSANLATVYEDVGLTETARSMASRGVQASYADFASHLFLANSYSALEDANRFQLRYESARQSEWLMANLLAPEGSGNLSQFLSQQDRLRYFDLRPINLSSETEYQSRGDWRQMASVFGNLPGFSYALDSLYESRHGERLNESMERRSFSFQAKQRVTPEDEAYLQVGLSDTSGGDLAQYYDVSSAKAGFHFTEQQNPSLYLGWHHRWSPQHQTVMLVSRLEDDLHYDDPSPNILFLRQSGGSLADVTTPPGFQLRYQSLFTLYSGEVQDIWSVSDHTLIGGVRVQGGSVDADAQLTRIPGAQPVTHQSIAEDMGRVSLYAYDFWQLGPSVQTVVGLSYDRLTYPNNSELPPLATGDRSSDRISPKVGVLVTPWSKGTFRANYTRSLGGVFFDNSIRLEPTLVGGLNQVLRSAIPESVSGLMAGTRFDTATVAFDQSLDPGIYCGVEADWIQSSGERETGALTNSGLLFPDTPTSTLQRLKFWERSLSLYGTKLLGETFSVGARYRLSQATLSGQFPEIPRGTPGLSDLEQWNRSILHHLTLHANLHLQSGFFSEWDSDYYAQSNLGYSPDRPGDAFWQHNLFVGYRFPRRSAELRVGVLNLSGTQYRLNPLNLYSTLPRDRTLVVRLKLNF